jgi:hypothetical protein
LLSLPGRLVLRVEPVEVSVVPGREILLSLGSIDILCLLSVRSRKVFSRVGSNVGGFMRIVMSPRLLLGPRIGVVSAVSGGKVLHQ